MDGLDKRLTRNAIVINELGLHARPAAMIAERALKAKSNIWLINDDQRVDASSIIDILSTACLKGTQVTLQIDDPADMDILDDIIDLFERGFGE